MNTALGSSTLVEIVLLVPVADPPVHVTVKSFATSVVERVHTTSLIAILISALSGVHVALVKTALRGSRTGPEREHHPHQGHPLQRPATTSCENRSCPHVAISLVNPSVCRQQRGETVSSPPASPRCCRLPLRICPSSAATSRPELGIHWATGVTAPPQGACGQELGAIRHRPPRQRRIGSFRPQGAFRAAMFPLTARPGGPAASGEGRGRPAPPGARGGGAGPASGRRGGKVARRPRGGFHGRRRGNEADSPARGKRCRR